MLALLPGLAGAAPKAPASELPYMRPYVEGFGVKEFKLKYLKPSDELLVSVRGVLGAQGSANLIKALNMLVVMDSEEGLRRVESLLSHIDTLPAQIAIYAQIVEVDTSKSRELGVKWSATNTEVSGNVLGSYGSTTEGVSMSLPTSTDNVGAISFGVLTNKLSLDMKLQALESSGAAHVVSSPRVVVLDNETATIASGSEVVLPSNSGTVVVSGGATDEASRRAVSFSALMELAVTPRLLDGGNISLGIGTRREEFDYAHEFDGFPSKTTKSASTRLIVRDGETVVIGGIYTKSDLDKEERFPLLGRIPVIGWLFKHSAKSESQSELMIFLTPNIVAPGAGVIANAPAQ